MDRILELLINNKEWLFSGLGVALIVGLFSILRIIYNRQIKKPNYISNTQDIKPLTEPSPINSLIEPKSPSYIEVPNNITFDTLSPKEIYNTIREAPLLQQGEVTKHYLGLKVKWEGNLIHAEKMQDDIVKLLISVSGEYIYFNVIKADYPGLGLLKRGAILTVEGIIDDIGGHFELKDAKIISITAHRANSH